MVRAPVIALALALLPAVVHADVAPEPTTGTTGAGTGTTAATDPTEAGDSDVPPPAYEPCGCGSERSGGAWSLLLGVTAGGLCRRRRPTNRRACRRAG
jgi:hypothetical protein